jgi:SpoVK/Ycf46/Vps4 family AAA+-type ATPase
VWSPTTERRITELIRQRHSTALLAEHGLSPATKVMFVGPPGVGKTMTATFLASELAVPLVVIDPTAIMSSYLGNSAKNLRAVLEKARHEECVLFFDEFDAIAKSRDDGNDIGEVKRLVNSLLLELDRSHRSLVIAATNYDQVLDPAIHRRFDTWIEFSLPGPDERRRLIAQHPALLSFGVTDPVVDLLTLATHEWSPSDIERHLNAVTRSAILASDGAVGSADPVMAVADWGVNYLNNPDADSDTRREIASVAVNVMHYSHRQAADLLGVTHPTISKWLKSA